MIFAQTREGRRIAAQINAGIPTNADLSQTLEDYQPRSEMGSYVTAVALGATLAGFVSNSALATTLDDYVTNTNLGSALSDYVTSASLGSTLSGYVTSASLGATLADYVTTVAANAAYEAKAKVVQVETPGIGATVTVDDDTDFLILDPSGPLATMTLNFPAATNQRRFVVSSTKNLVALTMSAGGATIATLVTGMTGGGAFEYLYDSGAAKWYRTR